MHLYKLSDKTMDSAFLKGDPVQCQIALHQNQATVAPGEELIIVLSTGAKYKGIIVEMNPIWLKDRAFGEMIVRRVVSL